MDEKFDALVAAYNSDIATGKQIIVDGVLSALHMDAATVGEDFFNDVREQLLGIVNETQYSTAEEAVTQVCLLVLRDFDEDDMSSMSDDEERAYDLLCGEAEYKPGDESVIWSILGNMNGG